MSGFWTLYQLAAFFTCHHPQVPFYLSQIALITLPSAGARMGRRTGLGWWCVVASLISLASCAAFFCAAVSTRIWNCVQQVPRHSPFPPRYSAYLLSCSPSLLFLEPSSHTCEHRSVRPFVRRYKICVGHVPLSCDLHK